MMSADEERIDSDLTRSSSDSEFAQSRFSLWGQAQWAGSARAS